MAVNTKSVFLGCKYACAQMVKQEAHASGDRGWIVNISSIYGLVGGVRNCKSFFTFFIWRLDMTEEECTGHGLGYLLMLNRLVCCVQGGCDEFDEDGGVGLCGFWYSLQRHLSRLYVPIPHSLIPQTMLTLTSDRHGNGHLQGDNHLPRRRRRSPGKAPAPRDRDARGHCRSGHLSGESGGEMDYGGESAGGWGVYCSVRWAVTEEGEVWYDGFGSCMMTCHRCFEPAKRPRENSASRNIW